jgi:hypothetical protein
MKQLLSPEKCHVSVFILSSFLKIEVNYKGTAFNFRPSYNTIRVCTSGVGLQHNSYSVQCLLFFILKKRCDHFSPCKRPRPYSNPSPLPHIPSHSACPVYLRKIRSEFL